MSSHTDSAAGRDWATIVSGGCQSGSKADEPVVEPSVQSVLRTVLGLRSQELATYEALSEQPGASTKELAAELNRDRSNVNRSLTRLKAAGLVYRNRQLLDSGGYVYSYYAEPGEAVEQRLVAALDEWLSAAKSAVETHSWTDEITADV